MKLTHPPLYTDFYELTMAQGYFLSGRHEEQASFDYFFRKNPFNGGYVVFAGLSDFLALLNDFSFSKDSLEYLRKQGFKTSFLKFLEDFEFKGTIFSVKEGEVVFPNEPLLRVEGTILETQILETLLLNILNFESLIATKAARIRQVAGKKTVLDFGLRRSQGFGGMQASKGAMIGGLDGTSNVLAGFQYGINISGTMAHSWIQSFENELTAFRAYAEHYPDSCVLLVDTYDTLKSGLPNAIKVGKELESKGFQLKAIRLDSGDLAYLSRKARQVLDEAGLAYVKIAASNQLDEYLIKSLDDQGAEIDMYGVGTKLVTAYDHPALDGVYKLSSVNGNPTLKISENVEKITLPGKKKIIRFLNQDGSFNSDGVFLENESDYKMIKHPYLSAKQTNVSRLKSVELLHEVVSEGKISIELPDIEHSKNYAQGQLKKLNQEHKRFDNPHVYKIGVSSDLSKLRDALIENKNS